MKLMFFSLTPFVVTTKIVLEENYFLTAIQFQDS